MGAELDPLPLSHNTRDYVKNIPGGVNNIASPAEYEYAFHITETSNRGHEKKCQEGNYPENVENPSSRGYGKVKNSAGPRGIKKRKEKQRQSDSTACVRKH